ncbi:MAG: hypothetical protein R2751_16920 [Bacteroidales bacterium]
MMGPAFSPRQAFRVLRLIYLSMNTGLILFFFVVVNLNGWSIPGFRDEVDMLTFVNVLLLVCIPLGYYLSNRRMATIEAGSPFARKWEVYQTAMIIRWAMIEAVSLFSLVGLMLLDDAKHLVLFILCILVFSLNSVTKDRVIAGAKLNRDEARALDL